jgi:hypothetical protein
MSIVSLVIAPTLAQLYHKTDNTSVSKTKTEITVNNVVKK